MPTTKKRIISNQRGAKLAGGPMTIARVKAGMLKAVGGAYSNLYLGHSGSYYYLTELKFVR